MKYKRRRSSRFLKSVMIYFCVFVVAIIGYGLLDAFDKVDSYLNKVREVNSIFVIINFIFIFVIVIIYGIVSLRNLLSHKASEDSREHCLPIILSPFFLLVENGLVHAFSFNESDPYYEVIMGIFSATALGVITFASLKFSFEISTKHNRLIETSNAKPNIVIKALKNGKYSVKIDRKECYLYGAYVGKIYKFRYWDIKRTGTYFEMSNLFFPNAKQFLSVGTHNINLSNLNSTAPKIIDELGKGYDVYLIFRDVTNYYYLAQIPTDKVNYNVIGVNEPLMERLVYKHSLKIEKKQKKIIKHRAMDWFNIPYNFNANYKA